MSGVARETWDDSLVTMDQILSMMQRNLPGTYMSDETEFIDFVVVPRLERPDRELGEIPVKGIQKLHSLVRTDDGKILGLPLTCQECLVQKVLSAAIQTPTLHHLHKLPL